MGKLDWAYFIISMVIIETATIYVAIQNYKEKKEKRRMAEAKKKDK